VICINGRDPEESCYVYAFFRKKKSFVVRPNLGTMLPGHLVFHSHIILFLLPAMPFPENYTVLFLLVSL